MIPNTKDRVVVSRGVEVSAEFGISKGDEAHLMTILRDTLYSDKILAVLREYSSNAWDAHREVGKADVPIEITLPTSMDQTLSIRDHGPGLSHEDVLNIYTQYGASTKRTSDNSVGMLGIGSKSGFAYSDSFIVVSAHKGVRRTYVAVLDQTERGLINLLNEEECGDDTGILIQIAVQPNDIHEFENTAKHLFKYFVPRPTINTEIPPLPVSQSTLKNGIIWEEYGGGEWMAVMGCVPYKIDLSQLKAHGDGLANFVGNLCGALWFNIGEVQINASREGLKYNDPTRKVLVERINALIDEYVTDVLTKISAKSCTIWEKRLQAQVLHRMSLFVPALFKDLVNSWVKIGEPPKTFTFSSYADTRYSDRGRRTGPTWEVEKEPKIPVKPELRMLIKDDNRALNGFRLGYNDFLIRKKPDPSITLQAVEAELEEVLVKYGLKGIKVEWTSGLPWTKDTVRQENVKYRRKVFRVKQPLNSVPSKKSEAWIAELDRRPTTEDIFVVISEFDGVGFEFLHSRLEDERLVQEFGGTLPPIYGYRTRSAKEVKEEDCLGTPYLKWREKFLKELISIPKAKKAIDHWLWFQVLDYVDDYRFRRDKFEKNAHRTVAKNLGRRHEITAFVARHMTGVAYFKSRRGLEDPFTIITKYMETLPEWSEADAAFTSILSDYPLFTTGIGLEELWRTNSAKWCQYVKLVDGARTWQTSSLRSLSPTIPSPSPGEERPTTSERVRLSSVP